MGFILLLSTHNIFYHTCYPDYFTVVGLFTIAISWPSDGGCSLSRCEFFGFRLTCASDFVLLNLCSSSPLILAYSVMVIRNIVPMFQYSPGARENDYVSLAFPREFLVSLSLKGGMAYLGELI